VVEIPVSLEEKRPPSIALFKRVPNVLRQVAKLFWVLRVQAPPARDGAGAGQGGGDTRKASGS
jgi:hypothetical protein